MTTINFNTDIEVTDELVQAVEAYIEENMGGTDYYDVHTEDSRWGEARDYIEASAWAFHKWFIAQHTSDGVTEDVIELLQTNAEVANEAILQLIEGGTGIETFVNAAIIEEGHGHFLSGYDGQEHEIEYNGETYYIYAN